MANTARGMSGGRFLGGAILVLAGVILTVTGVGALVGVPLGLLGFAVMFPTFTKLIVLLAVVAFVALLFVL